MRIYIVGSHATGKTTLCRYISRRYGLPMITEVARAVLAEMEASFDALRTDMDLVAEYQAQVFARQMAEEQMHRGRFVSDRAFDNLAYAAEHTTIVADLLASTSFAEYMKWVAEGVVLFLRPHPSLLREDGVRAGVSWDSVLRIDGMIKLLLEQHRLSYLPIESVSMQERVRAAEFVLGRGGVQAVRPARPSAAARPAEQQQQQQQKAPPMAVARPEAAPAAGGEAEALGPAEAATPANADPIDARALAREFIATFGN